MDTNEGAGDGGSGIGPGRPPRTGVILVGDTGPEWLDHVRLADRCGFWGLGVGDSQAVYPDVYVRLTLAATATRHVRIGPWVTNPFTRHPAVTARAIASVDEVSGGRAFLGLGTGDSAAATLGRPPARVAELEDYVRTVDRLQVEGAVDWQGRRVTFDPPTRRVPIVLAASGPRTLRLAGRVADGVVVATGLTPEIVAECRDELNAGARDAGRDPADLDVWWLALLNVASDGDRALEELKGSLATFANMAVKAPALRRRLAPEVADALEELARRYDPMAHAAPGASPNAALVDELDLVDHLRERFALCGTPERVAADIARVRAAGAENLWFSIRVPHTERVLAMWRDEVRGHLGDADVAT